MRLKDVPIDESLSSTKPQDMASVLIDPRVRYQEIVGFGGAFSGGAAGAGLALGEVEDAGAPAEGGHF